MATMDVSNAFLDTSHDESQSSQILDFVMGGLSSDGTKNGPLTAANGTRGNAYSVLRRQAGVAAGEDASLPSGTSASSSFSRYNFHGLADTQTQSQFPTDESCSEDVEGSQKENTPTTKSAATSTRPIINDAEACSKHEAPLSPAPPPLRSTTVATVTPQPLPLIAHAPPAKTKGVSFDIPAKKKQNPPTFKVPSEMPFKRRRSPSPSSQDSFAAGPIYENPDVFLANAKQFDRPIDRLGIDSQEESLSSVESQPPRVAPAKPTMRPMARAVSEVTPYSLSSASAGTPVVLVENSDESRSNTQESNEAADLSIVSDTTGDLGTLNFSQEPTQIVGRSTISLSVTSSMYVEHGLNDSSRDLDEPPSQPALQPEAAQRPKEAEVAQPPVHESESLEATQEDEVEPSEIADSVASDRRHILNMLPPEKRLRYLNRGGIFTPRVEQERRVAPSSRTVAPLGKTDEMEVVPDSDPQISLQESPEKSATSNVLKAKIDPRDEVIPATPSEPTASILEERAQAARAQPPPNLEEEEEEEEKIPEQSRKVEKAAEEVVDMDIDDVGKAEKSLEERETRKGKGKGVSKASAEVSKASKPALGMKGKARQPGPAGTRTRVSARKSGVPANVGTVSKRKVGKKAAAKPEAEDETDETTARAIRKLPVRKTVDLKGKGKASARSTPVPSIKGTPCDADMPYTPVSNASKDSPEVPLAAGKRDDEVATVLDEDEDLHMEEKTGTKRRRGNSSIKQARDSRTRVSRAESMSAPPSKRLKATPSVTTESRFTSLATRVIAPWNSDTQYYFGMVHSSEKNNPSRYRIIFDDDEQSVVDLSKLRRAEPVVGDNMLLVSGKNKRFRVVENEKWASERVLRVEITDDDECEEFDVSSSEIMVPFRTVDVNWADRKLTAEEIIPLVGAKPMKDRSPSKLSVVSGGEIVNPKILSRVAVAITLPAELSSQRDKYARAITALGGSVMEWADVYSFQGKLTSNGKRWFMRPEDVKYVCKDRTLKLFCLSDSFCNRPKYLIALALGIPCIGLEWLEACASSTEEVEWANYLLPAGVCQTISAKTSQLVDLDWGNCIEHITNIMTNHVPAKVFNGMSILCFGSDFVSNKKSAGSILEGNLAIPRLVLCMGAAYVEAVASYSHASFKDLSKFQYIVVKDGMAFPRSSGTTYVEVSWVKDCLFASRLLPSPPQNN